VEFPGQRGKAFVGYLTKMKGKGRRSRRDTLLFDRLKDFFWAWLGSSLGIALCAYLSSGYFEPRDTALIIGSFGASAVLVYGLPIAPLSQPKNLLGGHLISAVIGVSCYFTLGTGWVAAALAVSLAIVAMMLTDTVHPPGGATALIAIIGGEPVHAMGFWYVLAPTGLGAAVLLIIALLVNNLARDRQYPEYWF